MKKLILSLVLLFLLGCQEKVNYVDGYAFWAVEQINYLKDKRTGICFAELFANSHTYYTACPCDSIPEELLTIEK